MVNTTSKSTKAKTKTTKRPVAAKSITKVTSNKKSAKKTQVSTTRSIVSKPSVKASAVKRPNLFARLASGVRATGLRRLHGISAIVFVVLAIVAGALMKATDYQLSLGYLAQDELLAKTFMPAQQVLMSIDLRWVVVAVMIISALLSIARMTRLSATEDKGLKIRVQPWRWVDFALTGGTMIAVVAILYGIQDLTTLKLLSALVVFAIVFAWIAERENSGASKVIKGAYLASVLAGLVVLATLTVHGWSTVFYGAIRFPWYAYALFGSAVVTAAALTLNQYFGFRGKGSWSNYLLIERNYLLLNVVTKAAFAIILIVGLYA